MCRFLIAATLERVVWPDKQNHHDNEKTIDTVYAQIDGTIV